MRERLTRRTALTRVLVTACGARAQSQALQQHARKRAAHVALEHPAKRFDELVRQDRDRPRGARIGDVRSEHAAALERPAHARTARVHTAVRSDAEQRAERHDRECEPVAVRVVRPDRHQLLWRTQPRIDEALGEHRACERTVLVAVDVDQVHAAPVDEHVEIVAVADHDASAMQIDDRVVQREQRRDHVVACDRMIAPPARLAVRVQRSARHFRHHVAGDLGRMLRREREPARRDDRGRQLARQRAQLRRLFGDPPRGRGLRIGHAVEVRMRRRLPPLHDATVTEIVDLRFAALPEQHRGHERDARAVDPHVAIQHATSRRTIAIAQSSCSAAGTRMIRCSLQSIVSSLRASRASWRRNASACSTKRGATRSAYA